MNSKKSNKDKIYEYVEIGKNEIVYRGGNDPKFLEWYEKIYADLQNNLFPIINENNESLIMYAPYKFSWGIKKQQDKNANGGFYNKIYGNYATGYLCLSSDNLYFVTIPELTEKYPMFEKGANNFLGSVLGALAGTTTNNRTRHLKYTIYSSSYRDILSASILPDEDLRIVDELVIITNSTTWYCRSHFIDDDLLLKTGINMGMNNEFKNIIDDKNINIDECTELLKKIKDLYLAELITEDEYKNKKNEILKRL